MNFVEGEKEASQWAVLLRLLRRWPVKTAANASVLGAPPIAGVAVPSLLQGLASMAHAFATTHGSSAGRQALSVR